MTLMKTFNINGSYINSYEQMWSSYKNIPHYRYLARPMYKFFGGNDAPLVSVPLTFVLMDYICHQLPSNAFDYLISESNDIPLKDFFKPILLMSLIWLLLSIPVALNKEFKRCNQNFNVHR